MLFPVGSWDARWKRTFVQSRCRSFFATLERELLDLCRLKTQAEAGMTVFEFIEAWYNYYRHHYGPDYSPLWSMKILCSQPIKSQAFNRPRKQGSSNRQSACTHPPGWRKRKEFKL
jgi:hypothetical protein